MTNKPPRRELPTDISLFTAVLDAQADPPSATRLLTSPYWRDFIDQHLRETGSTAAVTAALAEPPQSIIPTVMKSVHIPLGGGCHIIKCPATRQPSACALCPVEMAAGEQLVCSGPTVQRTRTSLLGKRKIRYETKGGKVRCPYSIARVDAYAPDATDGFKHLLELIYPVLARHPEYSVVDYRKEYPERLEELGLD